MFALGFSDSNPRLCFWGGKTVDCSGLDTVFSVQAGRAHAAHFQMKNGENLEPWKDNLLEVELERKDDVEDGRGFAKLNEFL